MARQDTPHMLLNENSSTLCNKASFIYISLSRSDKRLPAHLSISLPACSKNPGKQSKASTRRARPRIHTLSMCASKPSWLLCLVVSLTRSFAWLANCSKSEPCEPCLRTPLLPPLLALLPCLAIVGWDCWRAALRGRLCEPPPLPDADAAAAAASRVACLASRGFVAEPKLAVRARTLPPLGWRCRWVGLIGGA